MKVAKIASSIQQPPRSHLVWTVLTLGAVITLNGCSGDGTNRKTDSSTDAANPPATWAAKMQELSKTLSNLMPLVTSKTAFNKEENQAKIVAETERLQSLAHSLQADNAPTADPGMKIMSGLFEEDIDRALESLKNGNHDYARAVLRDTTSYCVQCHTQTNNGPDFPRLSLDINTDELGPLNRAEFFAATRQFDRALETYATVIKDESLAQAIPFEWENAARSALAIAVRVKQSPKAATELVEMIKSNDGVPKPKREIINEWEKSIKAWAKEKKPAKLDDKTKLARAEALVKRAQNREEYPLEHSQDILYFRAASLLHDILSEQGDKGALTPRALYLAGIAAEATRDMNFWTLHETYYELCIRRAPGTRVAKQCFDRFKDSITLGYSGSGGVRIPPEVQKRVNDLQVLAKGDVAQPTTRKN